MNSAKKVNLLVQAWIDQKLTKAEIVTNTALAELGWCYVWGATGQECTPAKRRACIGRCSEAEAAVARKKCQVLRDSNPKSSCKGCPYYPDDERTLMDDCQGFVKQVCRRVGVSFTGGGCTSMWNTASNWAAKGPISTLPEQVCCVFWTDSKDKKKKSHIGFYIGNGWMVHCSGEVKKEKLSKRCTDWAIPKGLEGGGPVPVTKPTLRKGSKGEYVTLLQTMLIQRGYDLEPYGADGKFGNKTEAAVKLFQAKNGLEADGVVGAGTWNALENGEKKLYTVTIKHLSRSVAEDITKKYGGVMTAEGE